MRAVVLVGGEGTRLRPLTETIPKPLIPLMDRRFLDGVLDHLVRHGVDEAVMSSPYLEETFRPFLRSRVGGPRITWITEEGPLGTGGAIVRAMQELSEDEPVFALNGDILTDLDLTAMLAFHRERAAAATIALTHVQDARPFGLVPTAGDGRVLEFREKPTEPIPGEVNAGTYVLQPSQLAGWRAGDTISIEREIFPALIADGRPVYGFLSHAYWMDLGTPEKYLQAHFDLLAGAVEGERYPSPFVSETARVDAGARLGARVVVGARAKVGRAAWIEDSVLQPDSVVEAGATVAGSIVGPGARVGAKAAIRRAVLGENAVVPGGASMDDARVSANTIAEEPA
jgi:mannose-1-phosphate guanylyltransferase